MMPCSPIGRRQQIQNLYSVGSSPTTATKFMIKVRQKKDREVIHDAGCMEAPCECCVRRTQITLDQVYDAIKNPEPSLIVHDKARNKFRHDQITEIFSY